MEIHNGLMTAPTAMPTWSVLAQVLDSTWKCIQKVNVSKLVTYLNQTPLFI